MSCRHDLALGTCRRCYPSSPRATIDPGPEEDCETNLDGPGAVKADGTINGPWVPRPLSLPPPHLRGSVPAAKEFDPRGDELRAQVATLQADLAAAVDERDRLAREAEHTRSLLTAILAGNETLRDRVEAANRLMREASEEIDRLKSPEGLWYEHAMKMLALAPNFVAASFNMGDRRVEIVFYKDGGKTPGEVAAELRVERDALLAQAAAARDFSELEKVARRWRNDRRMLVEDQLTEAIDALPPEAP